MGQNTKIEENIKELYLLTEILTYIMKEQDKEKKNGKCIQRNEPK